jgi:predicted transglutaminase-like cysteine proteinase
MTEEKWLLVRMVNTFVNGAIAPVSDESLYGTAEYWTLPTDAGDCEDIMLLKKKLLVEKGISADSLRITVVLDENGGGHAVLTLITSAGDFILDNRRNDIRNWSATGYTFLKRQAQHDPRKWVSLEPNKSGVSATPGGTASE